MVNIAKIYANSSAQYEYEFAYSALLRVIIGQGQKKASGITSGSLSILYLLTLNIIGVLRVTTQISLYRGTKSHHSSDRDEESGLNLIYLLESVTRCRRRAVREAACVRRRYGSLRFRGED